MGSHCCCEVGASDADRKQDIVPTTDDAARPLTVALRCVDMARWMVPGAVLVLLPKCPACLAAYVAIGTGFGISISTATYVRFVARDGVANVVVIACCENPAAPISVFHATARLPGRKEIAPWKHRRTIIRAMVR